MDFVLPPKARLRSVTIGQDGDEMTPQKVTLTTLAQLPFGDMRGFTTEAEAIKACEDFEQAFYYWHEASRAYYVAVTK